MPRALSFDPVEKLQKAMLLFWQNGYEGTSIGDLINKLEINRFSLYQQFGDKHQLFRAALDHYNRIVFQPLLMPLRADDQGKAALDAYIALFTEKVSGPRTEHGCFISNTLAAGDKVQDEFGQQAREMMHDLQSLLLMNFEAAEAAGELGQPASACAAFSLMTIQALLMARKTQGKALFIKNAQFFREMVKTW